MRLSWRRADTVVPVLLAVGGAVYGVTAWGYGVGSMRQPGSGLFPVLVAVALVLSAGTWVVSTAVERPAPLVHDPVQDQLQFGPASHDPFMDDKAGSDNDWLHWWRVAGVAVAGTLVIPLTTWIGLVATSGVLVLTTALVMRVRWLPAVVAAALFTLVAYCVFDRWLAVALPNGFLFTMGYGK